MIWRFKSKFSAAQQEVRTYSLAICCNSQRRNFNAFVQGVGGGDCQRLVLPTFSVTSFTFFSNSS